MARPQKNNCDYFPHLAQGRNDRRLKAMMAKYGSADAYYVVFAVKEILTESANNKLIWTQLEIELIAGDLSIEVSILRAIIEYAVSLNYFQIIDQYLRCEELENDLRPVYEKRKQAKDFAASQKRFNGQFTTETTVQTVIPVTETPQSKVNKSKVNKNKKDTPASPVINFSFEKFWDLYNKKVGDKTKLEKKWLALTDEERQKAMVHIPQYIKEEPNKKYRKNPETYLNNKSFNDEVIENVETHLPKKNFNGYKKPEPAKAGTYTDY